jgi:hypothetical protein
MRLITSEYNNGNTTYKYCTSVDVIQVVVLYRLQLLCNCTIVASYSLYIEASLKSTSTVSAIFVNNYEIIQNFQR